MTTVESFAYAANIPAMAGWFQESIRDLWHFYGGLFKNECRFFTITEVAMEKRRLSETMVGNNKVYGVDFYFVVKDKEFPFKGMVTMSGVMIMQKLELMLYHGKIEQEDFENIWQAIFDIVYLKKNQEWAIGEVKRYPNVWDGDCPELNGLSINRWWKLFYYEWYHYDFVTMTQHEAQPVNEWTRDYYAQI